MLIEYSGVGDHVVVIFGYAKLGKRILNGSECRFWIIVYGRSDAVVFFPLIIGSSILLRIDAEHENT